MRIFFALAVIILSCPVVHAQKGPKQKPAAVKTAVYDGDLIVPGVRIGRFKIGDSEAQVLKELGFGPEEEFRYGRDMKIALYQDLNSFDKPFSLNDTSFDTVRIFYAKGRIVQVDVSANNYQTANKIGTGDSLERILRYYSAMQRTTFDGSDGDKTHIYDDTKRGIAFIVDYSYSYDLDEKPGWITVHQSGKTSLPPKNVKPISAAVPVTKDLFEDPASDSTPVLMVLFKPSNGLSLLDLSEGNEKGKATSPIVNDSQRDTGVFFYVKTHRNNQRLNVPVVRLTLIHYAQKPTWNGMNSASISFAGGPELKYKGSLASAAISEGLLRESFLLELPYEKFIQLAKSDKFSVGIGDERILFGKDEMAGVRALAKAVKPS